MTETFIKKDPMDYFDATYETQGVYNIVSNRFVKVSENKTKWIAESEFKFSSLMMKLMGVLMHSAFKKQSQIYLKKLRNLQNPGDN